MEEKHSESEIVIKISQRNLERLIYILIIVALIITTIIGFNRTAPNCPVVECNSEVVELSEVTGDTTEVSETTESTDTSSESSTKNSEINTIETTKSSGLSGEIDFLLQDVDTCIENETLDKGMFDSVTLYIKNGYDRKLNARVDLYLWSGSNFDKLEHYATKLEKLTIISGATLSREYTMDSGKFTSKGRFIDIDTSKSVKAVLIDTDLNKNLGERVKTGIRATKAC